MLEHERVSIAVGECRLWRYRGAGEPSREEAIARVGAIAGTLEAVFATAEERSITPLASARQVAHARLAAACRPRASETR